MRSWAHHHSCRHQRLKKPTSWLSRPAPPARTDAQGHTRLHCHTHRAMLTNPSVRMGTCKRTHQCLCAEDTPTEPAASSRMRTYAQSRCRDTRQKPRTEADLHMPPTVYMHTGVPHVHVCTRPSTQILLSLLPFHR